MFNLNKLSAFDDKIALNHRETIDADELFTYRQIQNDSSVVKNCLNRILAMPNAGAGDSIWRQYNIVIIFSTHSPSLLPTIIGIENSNGISCFVDSNSSWPMISECLDKFHTNICLCDEPFFDRCNGRSDVVIVETLNLMNRKCFLLQITSFRLKSKEIPIESENVAESSRILFGAMTSGTGNDPKLIGVTYKSFWPNVEAFSQKYGVSNEDVIFVSSPPTFDPFMLDVAIALFVGATILTVGQSVRLAPKQLLDLLFPSSVDHSTLHQLKCSIMQTTPSLFMRWTHSEIAERVLSPSSSLRILALGGEAFPWIETIALWQDWSGSHLKRIFNLYGLTEMSCWASAYEVTSDDVNLKRSVPIGTPIDNFTRFELTSNGELLLKTKIRKCFQSIISDAEVMKRDTEFVLHTGDVFEQRNDNELIFKCRTNAVVKVFGRKIDLSYLEAAAGTVEQVYQACCVYERQRKIVVIFIVANDVLVDTTEIKNKIKNALQAKNIDIISEICRIERMPLSAHGKVSKAKLLQIFNSKFASDDATSSRSICFLRILNESLGINIQRTSNAEDGNVAAKRLKTPNDLSFLGLGGTSLKAMHILNGLEEKFGTQFPQLLPMLLDEAISIDRIVDDLEKTEIFQSERMPSVAVTNEMDAKQRERWSVDMKKCIDATPTILHANETTVVSVGSHSKWLYNVRATDGVLISSIELPDRIESQVTQCDEAHAIVGCYDGHLYCFNIFSGKIVWKFNSGGMIKCKSLLMDEFAIFGNYSEGENLWCVNAANGALRWSQRVGSKSIYSNPIQVNALDFIVCTLDGFMFRLDATDGTVKWTISTDAPIFSTPMLVQTSKKDFIISGAVNGRVSCWDGDKNHIWSHQIDGNIFTSFDCCTNSVQKTVVDVIFGSHNHHLYCLAFDTETELCSERWKCQVAAPIRATPRIFDFRTEKSVFCCSTNGDINIISHNRGAICQRFAIDGEIFSTPAIDACCAFIGSRNNLFYCFDVS